MPTKWEDRLSTPARQITDLQPTHHGVALDGVMTAEQETVIVLSEEVDSCFQKFRATYEDRVYNLLLSWAFLKMGGLRV